MISSKNNVPFAVAGVVAIGCTPPADRPDRDEAEAIARATGSTVVEAGRVIATFRTTMDLMLHHMNDTAPPPSSRVPHLGPTIDAAIASMMHKDPACRPATVFAGVAALTPGRAATPLPIAEQSPITSNEAVALQPTILGATTSRPAKPRSRRMIVASGATLAIAMIAFLVISSRRDHGAARPAAPSETMPTPGSSQPTPAPVSSEPAAVPRPAVPSAEVGVPAAPTMAHITLKITPATAEVILDGAPVGRAFDIAITSATHRLVIGAKGYRERRLEFVARGNETISVDLARTRRAEPRPKHNPGLVGGKDL